VATDDLFNSIFPPNVRTADPETSKAASKRVEPKRGTHASQCLAMFRAYPRGLTYAEVERYTMLRGAWKRCSDLKALGLIVGTGETREGGEVYVAVD
jgi:hypothetical protein